MKSQFLSKLSYLKTKRTSLKKKTERKIAKNSLLDRPISYIPKPIIKLQMILNIRF